MKYLEVEVEGAPEQAERRSKRCDVLWTRARVMLANQSLMQQCPIRLLACVAVLAALLC